MTALRTFNVRPLVHLGLRAALGLCVLAGWSFNAQAQVKPEVAEQLMRASGAWAQLASVSPAVQSYLVAALNADPSGDAAKRQDLKPVSQALQKAYAPGRLRAAAAQGLSRQLSPSEAQQLLAWFGSELGSQVSAVESQAGDAAADPAAHLQDGGKRLASLSPERRALLGDVLSATHVTELQTEVLIQALQAIHRGTAGFMPRAAKVSPKELRSRLEAQRSELQQGYQSAGLSLASGFYARLSDEQLTQYRAFLQSPVGERLQALQQQAITKALREATEDASGQMAGGGSAGAKQPQAVKLAPQGTPELR
jgi:hypothetical protein